MKNKAFSPLVIIYSLTAFWVRLKHEVYLANVARLSAAWCYSMGCDRSSVLQRNWPGTYVTFPRPLRSLLNILYGMRNALQALIFRLPSTRDVELYEHSWAFSWSSQGTLTSQHHTLCSRSLLFLKVPQKPAIYSLAKHFIRIVEPANLNISSALCTWCWTL